MRRDLLLALALLAPALSANVRSNAATPSRGRGATRAAPVRGSETACRTAVQGFYDWYLKLENQPGEAAMDMRAVKRRPQWFSRALREGLAADAAAQAKNPNEIVGLDFDPFLASQDPAPRYVVRKVTRRGARYRAEVHAVLNGKEDARPAVVPELERRGSQWAFVDFVYPAETAAKASSSLLQVLREGREERRKGSR